MNHSKNTENKDIFSGLEELGFDNINSLRLYSNNDDPASANSQKKSKQESEEEKIKSMLYNKEIICPVCGTVFTVPSVKTSAARIIKKDSDFFIRYSNINPYFYDVWSCNNCGYTAMKKNFDKIRSFQIEKIQVNISSKWKGRKYPDIFNLEIAIERYKLALLNYVIMDEKASVKAMTCLKIAWMYRLAENPAEEQAFLNQALEGFNQAYYNEDFPIFGMDKFTTMYLIGELNRRTSNNEQAFLWFSNLITSPSSPQKLKDLARDQKDLIKDSLMADNIDTEDINADKYTEEDINSIHNKRNKKPGFFKKFFG